MDLASLGVRIETRGVEEGVDRLDALVDSAERAEEAGNKLHDQSKKTSESLKEVAEAAKDAAKELTAAQTSTKVLAETDEQAAERIQKMVARSLERRQELLATTNAMRETAEASREVERGFSALAGDSLGASFREAQEEIAALSDAMAHQAQSLDDIGERREWVTDLYRRGLVSESEYADHLKTLERQEQAVRRAISDHAREVEKLLRQYDPASEALRRLAADEKKLQEALRAGSITAEQHAKAMAGLVVSRAKWQAEAQGVQDVANKLNLLSLTSASAMRDYNTFLTALARGQYGLASRQIIQLSIRANALRAIMTPLGISIAGVAAAAGSFAFVALRAQKETYELHKAVVMTGHAAGLTAGQLSDMAASIDEIIGTRAAATSALSQLAATGRVASHNLEEFAILAQRLRRTAGQPIEETVRIFAELGRSPVEASKRLNEQLRHLTAAEWDQIRALERRGELERAGEAAQRAYTRAMSERTDRLERELGVLQRAARATGDVFREMWDAILNIGRPETPEEELRRLIRERGDRPLGQIDVGDARNPWLRERNALRAAQQARNDAREQELRRQIGLANLEAAAQEKSAKALQERIRAEEELERLRRPRLQAQLSEIQRELNASAAAYSNYESLLEQIRREGLVKESDYYAAKRDLIHRNTQAQIQAIEAENALLRAENQRIEADREAQPEFIANQTKIAENQQRIVQLRQQAATQLTRLSLEEEASIRRVERAYEEARIAAQEYLDALNRQRERELAGFGRGTRQREFDAGINEIEDRFAEQRRQLAGERRRNEITEEAYERELEIINDAHRRAIEDYEKYYERLEELQSDWRLGAQEAFRNYIDQARNVAKMTEEFFTSAFQTLEDAIVGFVTTGKFNFKDFANAVLADLIRIQVRMLIVQALGGGMFGGFGGIFGAGGGTPPLTMGGGIGGGMPAMFADTGIRRVPRDNQVAILHKDEAVLPRHMNPFAGGSFGGPSVVINSPIYAGSGTSVAQLTALLDQRDAAIKAEIQQSLYRGRPGWRV